jgi:hypothetical protein
MTTTTTTTNAAATWALLEATLTNQRRVHIHYQEHDRVICPHILG